MWTLAWKNLLKERVRLAISVGGVAFAVLLVVMLRGLYISYQDRASGYFDRVGGTAWVWQRNTASVFNSFSIVPSVLAGEIQRMPGVQQVRPFLVRPVGITIHGAHTSQLLVGFNPKNPTTGPVRMVQGTLKVGRHGIVIDQVFARRYHLTVGNHLTILNHRFHITGISSGGDMVLFQYDFVSLPVARALLQMPRADNALILTLRPGASQSKLASRIGRLSQAVVLKSKSDVIAEHQQVISDAFLPVIAVLLTLAFLVGAAVIGLTTYSAVLEKRREYGMLKAVGARSYQTAFVIMVQAFLTGLAGYALGAGLAHLAQPAAAEWVPQFVTTILPTDLVWIGLAAIVMSGVASAIPLFRINRIDPAEVFRS